MHNTGFAGYFADPNIFTSQSPKPLSETVDELLTQIQILFK